MLNVKIGSNESFNTVNALSTAFVCHLLYNCTQRTDSRDSRLLLNNLMPHLNLNRSCAMCMI